MNNKTIFFELKINDVASNYQTDVSGCLAHYIYNINELAHQTNRIRYEGVKKIFKNLHLHPSIIATDLFLIACLAYAADTRVDRYKDAQDSWTRRLFLIIPVSDVSVWDQEKANLQNVFQFLTGDIWDFEFTNRDLSYEIFSLLDNRISSGLSYSTDTVSLFSGGMDSFIGALDLLNHGTRPLLIGHSKSKDVSEFRNSTYLKLCARFRGNEPTLIKAHVLVDKQNGLTSREDTERGRSFLFFSLGLLTASALINNNVTRLIIPENGLISLNLPLTPLRLGAYSTRTTHPYLISKIQEISNNLGLHTIIENPYEFKTKGQMLIESGDAQFIADSDTMSCSRPGTRNANLEGPGHKHCGRCVPCIIRRAALLRAGISDINNNLTGSNKYRFDILNERVRASDVKGENVMAFKYLIKKIELHPFYLNASMRLTGDLSNIEAYKSMYQEGLIEVANLINTIQMYE